MTRSVITARWKTIGKQRRHYRYSCGYPIEHSDQFCPGELGETPGPLDLHDGPHPCWMLFLNYRRDDDGRYRVPRGDRTTPPYGWGYDAEGRRFGRRPIAGYFERQSQLEVGDDRTRHTIVGERPILPAVVYCPVCDRPNQVNSPLA